MKDGEYKYVVYGHWDSSGSYFNGTFMAQLEANNAKDFNDLVLCHSYVDEILAISYRHK